MFRQKIDYGIDLGTTNSALSRFEKGKVRIIKSERLQKDTTPSCIHFTKRNQLLVGDAAVITYNISRLPLIIGSLIIVFSVAGIVGIGVVRVRTPNIKKRYVRKRGEHLIVLEIKGSLTKELSNVLVKDRVSPLGRVVPEFEGPKPIVREGDAGTELIWRLGNLRPRSEIYLSYRIRPLVEAQLKMPRAYLMYRTDERKIRVFSKQIILE